MGDNRPIGMENLKASIAYQLFVPYYGVDYLRVNVDSKQLSNWCFIIVESDIYPQNYRVTRTLVQLMYSV